MTLSIMFVKTLHSDASLGYRINLLTHPCITMHKAIQETLHVYLAFVHFVSPILLLGTITSCHGNLDKKEYVAWVRDYENGLHVKKQQIPYYFDLQYQPMPYMMLQRASSSSASEGQDKSESAIQYYTLSIGLEDNSMDILRYQITNQAEKQQRLYYFSYQFQNDITLEENGKVFPCVLFHFESEATVNNARTFVLAFERSPTASKEATLIINSGTFGPIPVKIRVSKDHIPSLKL